MKIKKSTTLKGVYYCTRNIATEMKGNRICYYSWTNFFDYEICDIYETIYRKTFFRAGELHGLFYCADHSFLFCPMKGAFKLFALDIRPNSSSLLKSIKIEISDENGLQIYLPSGFAWGILTQDEDSVLQIFTTRNTTQEQELVMLDPFSDQFVLPWGKEEFCIADYSLPIKNFEDILNIET